MGDVASMHLDEARKQSVRGTMDEMQAASSNDLLHRLAKDRHKRMQKRQEVQLLCSDPCTDGDSLLTAPPECGYIQKIIIKEKNLSIVKPTRKMSPLKGHFLKEQGPGDATNDVDASQSKGHPLYHRIDIKDDDGQNITWMPQDDLNDAVVMLLKALHLRLKHMRASQQRFPQTTSRCLRKVMHFEEMKAEQQPVFSEYPADLKTAFDQDVTNVPSLNYSVGMQNGVLQMFKAGMEKLPEVPELKPTLLNAYLKDIDFLLKIIQNGPVKTYCSRRLKILSAKFELHQLTNHLAEMVELKVDGKQDFQSVCKVDTHVHAAAAMTQNELLNIMCKTYEQDGDVKVYKDDSGHEFSLCELYQKLHLNPKNIRLDTLDVHVDRDTFDRFDKFDKKYNPLGRSELKKVYLNTDNLIQGRYFADLVKGVAADYKQMAGNCFTELRISVRGTSPDEWSRLADWFVEQEVYSPHIRWVVQLPRHFQDRNLHSFGSLLENFFRPILEATVNPADCAHRNLHLLLKYVTGFDSVADESPEEKVFLAEAPPPEEWLNKEDPPYSYYIYYMYANMAVINYWRRKRDMNTFVLRPHSGEAGHFTHLLDAFLTSDNISHGINLTKNPVVQYLYYLAQIPIAMSPISNNSLFVEYEHNPFYEFFQKGLVVSLSTDDPLIFHTTNDPLLEEYAMASHFWKLTPCDLCEIASNSVRQSGLSHKEKQLYLGLMYQKEGIIGNELNLSNVAPIRVAYRYETLSHELRVLETAN